MDIDKLELHSLLYNIKVENSVKTEIDLKLQQADGYDFLSTFSYIKEKEIAVVNKTFTTLEQIDNINLDTLEELDKKVAFNFRISWKTIFLHNIINMDSAEIVNTILKGMPSKYRLSFFSKDSLTGFNKTKIPVFKDEIELFDYILYVLVNDDIKSILISYVDIVVDALEKLGTTINGVYTKGSSAPLVTRFVLEKNNCRISYFEGMPHSYGNEYYLSITTSNDVSYNWLDAGRQFFSGSGSFTRKFKFLYPRNTIGGSYTQDQLTLITQYISLMDEVNKDENKVLPITDAKVKELELHEKKVKLYKDSQEKISKFLSAKLVYKLSNLDLHGTPFKLNDVTYTKDSISYSGQLFKIINYAAVDGKTTFDKIENLGYNTIKLMIDSTHSWRNELSNNFNFIMAEKATSILDISFDTAYDYFMDALLYRLITHNWYKEKLIKTLKVNIGDIIVNFKRKFSTNKNGVVATSNFINGIKINKDDFPFCIYQAVSYNSQTKYDEFIKNVSYTSLKIHAMIKKGLYYSLYDPVFKYKVDMVIPVSREKNKNFLRIGDKEYKIRNTSKVLNSVNKDNIFEVVELLLRSDVVNNLNVKDLLGFISISKKEYEIRYLKTKNFVESTMKALGVKKLPQKTFHTGFTIFKPLEIQGNLRTYYIESEEPFKIYSGEEGKYICMLDKTPFVAPEVKLVNRLYALKNDSVISKQIATLNF